MRAADDDSVPVPHDVFRFPRGALSWKAPYLFVLIGLGGAFGVLVLAGRLSPSLAALFAEPTTGAGAALRLPLFVQLASAFSGLAALVLVLARAVREVDKRPYVAIAPVLAVFAGLVHASLRVDLSPLGSSSALVAFAALGVALMGGALTARGEVRAQQFGWGLVLVPCVSLLAVLALAKGESSFDPAERAYLTGLLGSSLLMGAAGVAARRLRSALQSAEQSPHASEFGSRAEPRASTHFLDSDDFADAKTMVGPAPLLGRTREGRDTIQAMAARASRHWRQDRVRTVALLVLVAGVAYFVVGGFRREHEVRQTTVAPAALPSAPLVVEQLSGSSQVKGASGARTSQPRERSEKGLGKSAAGSSRPASSTSAKVLSSEQHREPARAKPSKASRTAASAPSSAGLPAWGSEAMREFSGAKASKPVGGKTERVARPAPTTAQTAPSRPVPVVAAKQNVEARGSAREPNVEAFR